MQIIKLNAIASTNTYLKQLAKQISIEDETVLVTDHQKKGRGQLQNKWHSQPGKSLTFSVYKRFEDLFVGSQFVISMVVSLAVKHFLNDLGVPAVQIKWPNDIMAGGKKCGGILIENELRGDTLQASIIGIGLNVNEKTFQNLPNATSLYLETNVMFDLALLLSKLSKAIIDNLNNMNKVPLDAVKIKYEEDLYLLGVSKVFKTSQGTFFQGKITGILYTGELCVVREDGDVILYNNKEIIYN